MNQAVMTINEVRYVERKPNERLAQARGGVCLQCAFIRDAVGCHAAVEGLAQSAFGGDCFTHDVVYVHAEPRDIVCRCECGREKEVLAYNLKNGNSRSCGCSWGGRRETVAAKRDVKPSRAIAQGQLLRCVWDLADPPQWKGDWPPLAAGMRYQPLGAWAEAQP